MHRKTCWMGMSAALALGCPTEDEVGDALENLDEACRQAVIEVTTTEMEADPDAVCRPGERCTLRAAIHTVSACSDVGDHTIGLQAGEQYELSAVYEPPSWLRGRHRGVLEREGPSMLPVLDHPLRILGRGATIRSTRGRDEVLAHVTVDGDVAFTDVTLQGAPLRSEGVLVLDTVGLEDIDLPVLTNLGHATVRRVDLEGPGLHGGYLVVNDRDGSLTIEESRFADLRSVTLVRNGGSLQADGVTIESVRGFDDADDIPGGGAVVVHNRGSAHLRGLTASGDTYYPMVFAGPGGGVVLEDCTVSDVRAEFASVARVVEGGGLTVLGGGLIGNLSERQAAIQCDGGQVTLSGATLSRNEALDGIGGGALNQNGDCAVTVSDGTAFVDNLPMNCFRAATIVDLGGNTDSDGTCL